MVHPLWFELGKLMLRKHLSVFQDDLKYIGKDIVNPFHVRIIHYVDCVGDMHDLENHLPPPLMKGESFEADNLESPR